MGTSWDDLADDPGFIEFFQTKAKDMLKSGKESGELLKGFSQTEFMYYMKTQYADTVSGVKKGKVKLGKIASLPQGSSNEDIGSNSTDDDGVNIGEGEINALYSKCETLYSKIGSYTTGLGTMRNLFKKVLERSMDLRPLFSAIGRDWFSTNESVAFSQTDPGADKPYLMLSWKYVKYVKPYGTGYKFTGRQTEDGRKEQKRTKIEIYPKYPVLVRSGILKKSLTVIASGNYSIFKINKKSMKLGTSLEYAAHLAQGKFEFTGTSKSGAKISVKHTDVSRARNPVIFDAPRVASYVEMTREYLDDMISTH